MSSEEEEELRDCELHLRLKYAGARALRAIPIGAVFAGSVSLGHDPGYMVAVAFRVVLIDRFLLDAT